MRGNFLKIFTLIETWKKRVVEGKHFFHFCLSFLKNTIKDIRLWFHITFDSLISYLCQALRILNLQNEIVKFCWMIRYSHQSPLQETILIKSIIYQSHQFKVLENKKFCKSLNMFPITDCDKNQMILNIDISGFTIN